MKEHMKEHMNRHVKGHIEHLKTKKRQIGIFALGILIVLALFFAGCMKQVPDPDAIPSQAQQPAAPQEPAAAEGERAAAVSEGPSTPAAEDEPLPGEQLTMEEKLVDQSAERQTIGNRVNEDYVEETSVKRLEGTEGTIYITAEKKMTESALIVSKGTTLTWENQDKSPHIVLIEEGVLLIIRGPRLATGDKFSYKFDKEGEFLARDIFSGTARMTVTVS